MARSHSQCDVLHQDFLAMQLPESRFDGVFANASLFHVLSQEMPKVLLELLKTLKPRGVLFSSNPRGNNEEGMSDGRYACFFDLDTWRVTSPRPASWRWATTTARRDCRGISSRGSRPFGAKPSAPGRTQACPVAWWHHASRPRRT
jgi:SAM-dependent methyltransferase